MKNVILFFSIFFSYQIGLANKYTLDNSPGSPADFTVASDAMSAISDGDTIYVQPSATSYGTLQITKRVVLLGAGHNPEFSLFRSEFSGLQFFTGSGQSIIKGIYVSNIVTIMAFQNVPNVVLANNFLTGQNVMNYESWSSAPQWLVEANVIYSTGNYISLAPFTDGAIFRNNIICIPTSSAFFGLPIGVVFDHNTFVFSGNTQVQNLFGGSNGLSITNNVFYITSTSTGDLSAGCSSCFWENNMTHSINGNIMDLPGFNYNNVDPLFVNVPSSSPLFLYSNDYNLTALSPALNAGSDGSDIGFSGGITPFNMFGFDPSLPRLREVTLLQNSAPINGTITLRVRGNASGN